MTFLCSLSYVSGLLGRAHDLKFLDLRLFKTAQISSLKITPPLPWFEDYMVGSYLNVNSQIHVAWECWGLWNCGPLIRRYRTVSG